MPTLDRLAPYRPVLYVVGALGFFGLNGVLFYFAALRPDLMAAALANPIGLVFVLEAFLMMGFLAWVIARLGPQKPGWGLFVILSVVGSLAFSVRAPAAAPAQSRRLTAPGGLYPQGPRGRPGA